MKDIFLELGQRPRARKLIRSLGLPVPLPHKLERAHGPWTEHPLRDRDIAVGGTGTSTLTKHLATTLCSAGANPFVSGDDKALAVFAEPGLEYGRAAQALEPLSAPESVRFHGLVFDATELDEPAALRAMYDFFHPLARYLAPNGRAIVLGRSPDTAKTAAGAATQAALEGFARSLAKEVGRRGSTAQLVYVDKNAEVRLAGVLRFLLAPHSAYISGQRFRVTAKLKTKAEPAYVRALDGKVALVTGAARGIGAATSKLLAAEGAHVVCLDRPADEALVSEVARDAGGSTLLADVTDADAAAQIGRFLVAGHGGVDIVVHNAGVTRDRTLAKMSPEAWNQAIDINLGAVVRITETLLEGGLRDDGRIICLSSVAGVAGNLGQTNYAASKAGVIGYVHNLAGTLAKRGISVNAIAPGFIETRLTEAIPVVLREAGRRLCNLSQGGLPEDVAQAIAFLATPAASGLTGSVLRVCGGALIGA